MKPLPGLDWAVDEIKGVDNDEVVDGDTRGRIIALFESAGVAVSP